MFYVVPNVLGNEIDRRLDAAIAEEPDAEKDREHLRSTLIEYYAQHGVIPDFSVRRTSALTHQPNGDGA